jgi:hypothetical protein
MHVPDDCTPQGWGAAHVPESSGTLAEVLTHRDQLVEDSILTAEERAFSGEFHQRLFPDLQHKQNTLLHFYVVP